MIIVKTKNGDHFINEKAVAEVKHDREKAVVDCWGANGYYSHHEDVEGVVYTNDAQPTSWTDEGSYIKRLKDELEREKKESDKIYKYYSFVREWYLLYQNTIFDIKNAIKRSENGSKCEDLTINELIKNAEKKYEESERKFNKMAEKYKD